MRVFPKVIILTTIIMLFLFPGIVNAATFIDDQYLKWEVLERQSAEQIIGENESSLYIRLNGSQAKIKKELNSAPELLKPGEECSSESFSSRKLEYVDKNLLQLRDMTLYYRDIPLMNMGQYIEENERFYQDNPGYPRSDISFYAYEYNLAQGDKILQVITIVKGYIPPPYTPSYSDTFWLSASSARRLALTADFRLETVWGNTDGSLGLAGWLKEWKTRRENSLFLIGSDWQVFSLNEALKKNDIEVLGREEDSLIIRAETHNVSLYILPDKKKYQAPGGGIYSVRFDHTTTLRSENIKDCQSFYLDQKGFIFALSSDGKEIKNLTTRKSYRLAEAVTPFDREAQGLEDLNFEYGTAKTRTDLDNSKWYVQDMRIIHERQGKKTVFNKGLPVLMAPVENLFIDEEGGKWFLGPAGIAYYSDDMTYALNMNPRLDGGISPGQTENLYIDGQKRIWFFDKEIKCAPFQGSTITASESSLLQDFAQVNHEYCESERQGVFIYQKENSDGSYTIRVLTINREGIINHRDLTLNKKLLRYFVYNDQIHLVLPDGILILEAGQNVTIRNSELLQELEFRYRDHDSLVFTGPYRIVTVRIPKLGEAVDTFVKTSSTVMRGVLDG